MTSKVRGFTLIELMLSMAYLSILLVMIGMLTMQITNIYTKGVTMRTVNQSGADIVDDITTTLNQALPTNVQFVSMKSGATVVGGRLCTGISTYAWNYSTAINRSLIGANTYTNKSSYNVRFVKVPDGGNTLCQRADGPDSGYPEINQSQAVELLPQGDRSLALSSFSQNAQSLVGGQTIYAISLTLGTDNQADIIDNACQGTSNYCAVDTFMFTARATGGSQGGGS